MPNAKSVYEDETFIRIPALSETIATAVYYSCSSSTLHVSYPITRMDLLSSGFFNIIFFVLILYRDADPPALARARTPPRGHADSCLACQQDS